MKGFEIEYTSKEEDETIFYRYRYLDCRFWFSRKPNGNIYMVHIESVEYPQQEYELISHVAKSRSIRILTSSIR